MQTATWLLLMRMGPDVTAVTTCSMRFTTNQNKPVFTVRKQTPVFTTPQVPPVFSVRKQ